MYRSPTYMSVRPVFRDYSQVRCAVGDLCIDRVTRFEYQWYLRVPRNLLSGRGTRHEPILVADQHDTLSAQIGAENVLRCRCQGDQCEWCRPGWKFLHGPWTVLTYRNRRGQPLTLLDLRHLRMRRVLEYLGCRCGTHDL